MFLSRDIPLARTFGDWHFISQCSTHNGFSYYGEWVVGLGVAPVTTTTAGTLRLSVTGLSAGTHTLLAYHNAWDSLTSVSTLNVAVNGTNQQVRFFYQHGSLATRTDFIISRLGSRRPFARTAFGARPPPSLPSALRQLQRSPLSPSPRLVVAQTSVHT